MKFKNILFDFDDTLVDFYDAEKKAFYNLAQKYNHQPTQQDFEHFKKVNQAHWEAFQQNKLTKDEVLSQRFINYFNDYQIHVNGKEADKCFRAELAIAPVKLFDHTLEVIQQLKLNHSLYIVTNGVTETQLRRIAQTQFNEIFQDVFISEKAGFQKPMTEFFDFVFEHIGENNRNQTLIVGDSLTSDILGGKNANISTCWFNIRQKENHTSIQPDYIINDLSEMIRIVE